MRNQLLLYSLFFSAILYGQENKRNLTGKVFFNKTTMADVHIVNKNNNQGTITNDFGVFEISVAIGDVLEFSHLNLAAKELMITQEIVSKEIFTIILKEKTYQLEEIIVKKQKSILYLDRQLLPPPVVNASTLGLPFANSNADKETAIVKISSGTVLSLDNLINSLNGNHRRKKMLLKLSKEDAIIAEIRNYFTDDFFITDLKIQQKDINPFLNYCFKRNIVAHYNNKDLLKLTKVLMTESKSYPQNKNEIALIKKDSAF